jgi:hypothetical protein
MHDGKNKNETKNLLLPVESNGREQKRGMSSQLVTTSVGK